MLVHDAKAKSSDVEGVKEQPVASEGEKMASSDVSLDSSTIDCSKDVAGQPGSQEVSGVSNEMHTPTVYAPQPIYYGGYENSIGGWDEYPQYLNVEGVEMSSPGVYHPGYGYNPQMPYGPYSPSTTPVPPVHPHSPMYSPQQFPYTGSYYPPVVPPTVPYISSPTHISQADLSMPSSVDQQGGFVPDGSMNNSVQLDTGPGYSPPYGSLGRGNFSGSAGNNGYYDFRQGFDGFGYSGSWSNSWRMAEGQNRSLNSLAPSSAQPVTESLRHNIAPLAPGAQRSAYGSGASINTSGRVYGHGGFYNQGVNVGRSGLGFGANSRSWVSVDKGQRRIRGNGSLCSCNGTLDIIGEQNKGPRATRPRSSDQESNTDGKNGRSTVDAHSGKYNKLDFVTEYEDAKFFIIKSYNEDNVHKSIKYGVWASTTNGNRKLDSAYNESKEKGHSCPVFLLFSVNASAQFCGVAEMVGPVDFDKSVDYWQQDKWSGQFPVKWHIVKDVPNSLFRHIILENNDNKPVTNSRDTQEVRLDQGIEILKIFMNYDSKVSILDDFDYYEERERVMQERRARQQSNFVAPVTTNGDHPKEASPPMELVRTFASVVRLGESKVTAAGQRFAESRRVKEDHDIENSTTLRSELDK
ncbi:YTH domain-containing protein ECT4-like isoform X2 [Nymphaea colorata]|uniref:YTH domain-containing protein ECT4-like isoform X2 n=1 Tax=Nymphaea colorata TaxID=210225 RepID=UPI00129E1976|nr:YTH domain-containing protein ECT4-like isoform X2 [Nymphaea colorata]